MNYNALSNKEKEIFDYAYNLGKQDKYDENNIITKTFQVECGWKRDLNFRELVRDLSRKHNVKCAIDFVTSTVIFPFAGSVYDITLTGKEKDIESIQSIL